MSDRKQGKLTTGKGKLPAADHRPALSREMIIGAALSIVDRDGLKALSMRRLGAELGVDPMAVYYHIPNKSALLDGIVGAVMSEIDLDLDDPSRPVSERIMVAARAYRDALLAHPRAIEVMVVRPPRTPEALMPVEILAGIFHAAGFSATDTMAAVDIFAAFVRGCAIVVAHQQTESELREQEETCVKGMPANLPPEQFPQMAAMCTQAQFIGFEAEFERGMQALIKGLLETYGNEQRSD